MLKKSPNLVKKLLLYLMAVVVIATATGLALVWYFNRKPTIGGDFILDYRGSVWKLSEHAKKLNILYFGYAQCPDVCPLSLSVASQAFRQLSTEELKDVQLVFLSVDYKNDKADQVADYAVQFSPEFIGLTGTQQQIEQTVGLFKASFIYEQTPKTYLGYSITHTDRLYFLDKKGFLIETDPSPRDFKTVLQKIKENL